MAIGEEKGPSTAEREVTTPDSKLWTDQWYPVADNRDLRPGQLLPVRIFDHPLLLFLDGATGLPTALDDVCPHRAVKLSEGRLVEVDGATIVECAYHGWQFGTDGACVERPAAPRGEKAPPSCNVRRYAVETNSVGLICIFFGDLAAANVTPVPGPTLSGPDVLLPPPYSRTLPVSFGSVVENVVDAAHAPFAHHGTGLGKRDSFSSDRVMRVTSQDAATGGLTCEYSSADGKMLLEGELSRAGTVLVNRRAPGEPVGKGLPSEFEFIFQMTPVSRHETKLFMSYAIAGLPKPAVKLAALLPRWVSHNKSHLILDGDTHLLNQSEALLARRGQDWRAYVLRNGMQDGSVAAWRRWFGKHAGAMPFLTAPHAPTERPIAHINDRFRWHGEDCVACAGALRNFRAVRVVALVLLALAMAFAAGAAGAGATKLVRRAVALMVAAAVTAVACQRGIKSLTLTDTARRQYES